MAVSALASLSLHSTAAVADDAVSSDDQWYTLAQQQAEQAEQIDWAAVSEAAGCTLVDVTVTEEVMPEVNAEIGAPSDLALPVVERVEECGSAPAGLTVAQPGTDSRTDAAATDGTARLAATGSCIGVTGGVSCISRSGSYISTSYQYNGSGTISAFLKLYTLNTSSGCPTGTTLATGSSYSYSDGTRRSLSVYAPGYDRYSGHLWKYVGFGVNSDWGGSCAWM